MKMETALAKKTGDIFTKAKRSFVMSRIRSGGNKDTELALARLLRAHGIVGWRRHLPVRVAVDGLRLRVDGRRRRGKKQVMSDGWRVTRKISSPRSSPGTRHSSLAVRPDFVFLKSRTAVFVDGCFWHGCPKHGTQPRSNRAFWRRKFSSNKRRDALVNRTLRRANWRVLRIWECQLKKNPLNCVERIRLDSLFDQNGAAT